MGLIEPTDSLLDFVCQAVVEAGAFRQAVILLSDERFIIQHAGVWTSSGGEDGLRESLRGIHGQPLRPYEFSRREQRIGKAIFARMSPSREVASSFTGNEWQNGDQLFLPLLRADGTVVGYFSVDDPTDGSRPAEEIVRLLDVLLDHSALHIEALRLRNELKKKADDLELLVQERTNELRLSQDNFSRLVNSTTDIVYITDENDRLTYLNEAFTQTLGYIRENCIGRPLHKLLEELSTDNPMNRRAIQDLSIANGEHAIYHVEVLARSGDKRTLEINRTIMRQGSTYKGSQGIARDITEHRAMLQQLVAAERLATTGRLAAGVAHEINNPLQAITSHLNAAQQKIQDQQDPAENINQIREGLERIRQIVRGMLDLHRAPQAPRVPVNLNEVIGKVTALVGRNLNQASVELKLDLTADLHAIQGSPQELQQVLLNLVLNAVESMPDGGELTISTRHSDANVGVRVQDTGTGIPPEHLSQIFEPFFTYKPSGTGLGLYLSKNIVEMHQGKIAVASEKGKGTTFTLTFPVI
jgi:PAS domain S-box-containing protein